MDLSKNQEKVVRLLYNNPGIRLTTSNLTRFLQLNAEGYWTTNQVRKILVRLMNRGIVVRDGQPFLWWLSVEARRHINAKGFKSDSKTS